MSDNSINSVQSIVVREYIVDISAVASELLSEPNHRALLASELGFNALADGDIFRTVIYLFKRICSDGSSLRCCSINICICHKTNTKFQHI